MQSVLAVCNSSSAPFNSFSVVARSRGLLQLSCNRCWQSAIHPQLPSILSQLWPGLVVCCSCHAIGVGSLQFILSSLQLFLSCGQVSLCGGLSLFSGLLSSLLLIHVLGVRCHLVLQRLLHHCVVVRGSRFSLACICQFSFCFLFQIFQDIHNAS